jgi:hypothetical protein
LIVCPEAAICTRCLLKMHAAGSRENGSLHSPFISIGSSLSPGASSPCNTSRAASVVGYCRERKYRAMGSRGLERIENVGLPMAKVIEDLIDEWADPRLTRKDSECIIVLC